MAKACYYCNARSGRIEKRTLFGKVRFTCNNCFFHFKKVIKETRLKPTEDSYRAAKTFADSIKNQKKDE